MNSRSSFVLAIGFGILIVLIAVLGIGAVRRAGSIYVEMQTAQDAYQKTEAFRRPIVQDMYLADVLVRDYLLVSSPEDAEEVRAQLREVRDSLQNRLDQLSQRISENDSPKLRELQEEVERYWESLNPIFEWTVEEKALRSSRFLRNNVLPHRQAVVELAREMARINEANLRLEGERLQTAQQVLRSFLLQMIAFTLGLGILVALVTIFRVAVLEKQHEEQRKQIEETQNNLRRLSRRLVQTQEVERRALSRELHDEVGQMMTALGIELGNLEDVRLSDARTFQERLDDAKRLNADAMRAVRDLAMGLRPSMLDDLGLQAALEWQGRDFSRHTGVPASVEVEGSLDDLTDAQRTCIYRIVQEALTNCARHANASNVLVSVRAEHNEVVVVVQDDGVGFSTQTPARGGLGLIGIQERVKELDGRVRITSSSTTGTTIRVEIPVGVAA